LVQPRRRRIIFAIWLRIYQALHPRQIERDKVLPKRFAPVSSMGSS
jgi:hypothetical protein